MDKKKKKHQGITEKELADIRSDWFARNCRGVLKLQEEAWVMGFSLDTLVVSSRWLLSPDIKLNKISGPYGETTIVYKEQISPIDKVNIR